MGLTVLAALTRVLACESAAGPCFQLQSKQPPEFVVDVGAMWEVFEKSPPQQPERREIIESAILNITNSEVSLNVTNGSRTSV